MELSRVHLCLEILIDLTLGASWRGEVVACDRKISAARAAPRLKVTLTKILCTNKNKNVLPA